MLNKDDTIAYWQARAKTAETKLASIIRQAEMEFYRETGGRKGGGYDDMMKAKTESHKSESAD